MFFKTLATFRATAKRAGFQTKLVTRSKINDYWQARYRGVIVGYFNTQFRHGAINFQQSEKIDEDPRYLPPHARQFDAEIYRAVELELAEAD